MQLGLGKFLKRQVLGYESEKCGGQTGQEGPGAFWRVSVWLGRGLIHGLLRNRLAIKA